MSEGQSICPPPVATPFPCMRRFQSINSAAPTSTFFGSHPRKAQVPPYGRESMIATSQPALRHFCAALEPAAPVPTTMRSNPFFICWYRGVLPFHLLRRDNILLLDCPCHMRRDPRSVSMLTPLRFATSPIRRALSN